MNMLETNSQTLPSKNLKCHLMTLSALASTSAGNRQTDLLCCFEIDDEFELRWLLHRQISVSFIAKSLWV